MASIGYSHIHRAAVAAQQAGTAGSVLRVCGVRLSAGGAGSPLQRDHHSAAQAAAVSRPAATRGQQQNQTLIRGHMDVGLPGAMFYSGAREEASSRCRRECDTFPGRTIWAARRQLMAL